MEGEKAHFPPQTKKEGNQPRFIEHIPDWEKKERKYYLHKTYDAMVKKYAGNFPYVQAERNHEQVNDMFGPGSAKLAPRFGNYQVIEVIRPDIKEFADILGKNGKPLPSSK